MDKTRRVYVVLGNTEEGSPSGLWRKSVFDLGTGGELSKCQADMLILSML